MQIIAYFNVLTVLLFGLIWMSCVLFLRRKKQTNLPYLLFFTVFYIYLVKVLDYTLIQFQSLLLLKHFVPNLMLRGQAAATSLNLLPLASLTLQDMKTSLLNILLFVPFGFGLPFITNARLKKVLAVGALVSVGIEVLQFITGQLAQTTFRIADINDVIFNTMGVLIGYGLFMRFLSMFHRLYQNKERKRNAVLQYIAERPQKERV